MASIPGTSSRRSSEERSRGRIGNWLVLAAAVPLAAYAAVFAFSVIQDGRNPAAALALNVSLPDPVSWLADMQIAQAAQRVAQKNAGPGATPGAPPSSPGFGASGIEFTPREREGIRRHARDALRMTPLTSAPLRQLAIVERDPEQRMQLLQLARSISRRDVAAALQLAELQFRQNQVSAALAELNRALLVSSSLDQTVFPLLAGAAADPQSAEQLRVMLRTNPKWADRLIRWAIANPASLGPLSAVVGDIPARSPARDVGFGKAMVDLLAGQRRFAEAFAVQRAYGSRPPAIGNLTSGRFQPLDWQLIDNYDSGSRPFGDDVLEVFANPGRRGDVAQIVTQLRPGAHRFALRIDETVGRGGDLRLTAQCLEPRRDRELAERTAPLADGTAALSFVVPPTGCRFQRLLIRIAAANDSAGALIKSAALHSGTARAPTGR